MAIVESKKMGEGMSAFVPNCNHGYAVKYNEFNKVVQCHVCGQVWIPLVTSTDEEYAAKVKIEQGRIRSEDKV